MYIQSNTLLLAGGFDPTKFISASGLTWRAGLKKTKLKLDLLTNIEMLLMVYKGIRGGICHSIYLYAKANSKCMIDFEKIKNPHILNIGL